MKDLTSRDLYQMLLDHVARDGNLSAAERAVMTRVGLSLAIDTVSDDLAKIGERAGGDGGDDLDPLACYRHVLERAGENGIITAAEQQLFASLRRSLNVSPMLHEKLMPEVLGQTPVLCGKCKAIVNRSRIGCPVCLIPLGSGA